MAKKAKRRWSMEMDRELIRLATTTKNLERLATLMERFPDTVLKQARRLGVYFKSTPRQKNRAN